MNLPAALTGAVDEARRKVATIRDKKSELAGRRTSAQDKIRELVTLEASALVENDGGDAKLARKRELAEGRITSSTALLSELEKFESKAQNELRQAEQAVESFINGKLTEGRSVKLQQLEIVQNERGRQLSSLRPGEFLKSARPNKSSKSKIANCESCQADIAIIRDDIRQPVTAECFRKLPRFDHLPFIPGQELKYFLCPVCRKTPWLESDRILTNRGYRMIPEPEQEAFEETDKKGESNA